jgi:hypothetical protein
MVRDRDRPNDRMAWHVLNYTWEWFIRNISVDLLRAILTAHTVRDVLDDLLRDEDLEEEGALPRENGYHRDGSSPER